MVVKERKIRKTGNSLSITLSREFLNSIGVKEGDSVLVDESKLSEAIVKVGDLDKKVDMVIQQSLVKNEEVYKELVDR